MHLCKRLRVAPLCRLRRKSAEEALRAPRGGNQHPIFDQHSLIVFDRFQYSASTCCDTFHLLAVWHIRAHSTTYINACELAAQQLPSAFLWTIAFIATFSLPISGNDGLLAINACENNFIFQNFFQICFQIFFFNFFYQQFFK